MTAAASRNYADLRCAILAVDDLVIDVALYGRVRLWDAEKRSFDEVCRVVNEVSRWVC
jgi:hypothetical protein